MTQGRTVSIPFECIQESLKYCTIKVIHYICLLSLPKTEMAAWSQICTGGRKKGAQGHWKPPKTNTGFSRFARGNASAIFIPNMHFARERRPTLDGAVGTRRQTPCAQSRNHSCDLPVPGTWVTSLELGRPFTPFLCEDSTVWHQCYTEKRLFHRSDHTSGRAYFRKLRSYLIWWPHRENNDISLLFTQDIEHWKCRWLLNDENKKCHE